MTKVKGRWRRDGVRKGSYIFVVLFAALCVLVISVISSRTSSTTTIPAVKFEEFKPSKVTADMNSRTGPFKMPIKGKDFEFFQPFYDMDEAKKNKPIYGPPEEFIKTFEERIAWADTMVTKTPKKSKMTTKEHATEMYIELIKSTVTAYAFNDAELSVNGQLGTSRFTTVDFDGDRRKVGLDWTYAGDSMAGWKRIDNILELLTNVIENKVEGDYIETGVWRGGASVFAKAALTALEPGSTRISYVCDSFRGLPAGEKKLHAKDEGWDKTLYLEVPSDIVANNFIKYGMLDSNIVFAKGFFKDTMPPLSKEIKKLSIMRLDGDMYESTVDVLYHLYDKLSIGGFVIMDDWHPKFPSRAACRDFFKVHKFQPEIVRIDDYAAYWKKTEQVEIQYWRYEQSKFKD